ncbi:MAG: GNAT family N-acetyltransferase [Luteimonas sp.]
MNSATQAIDVRHDPEHQRFAADVDGVEAHLDYQLRADAIRITHTDVPAAISGRGIGGELMRVALDHARAAGLKVTPACSYARTYFDRHPQYADLLAD